MSDRAPTKAMNIHLPLVEKEWLEGCASYHMISQNAVIVQAIRAQMAREQQGEKAAQ
jgi:hypothetical protein